jgi:L-alanine-DL-glutamate epimerase-like enolase superfamily enzyme
MLKFANVAKVGDIIRAYDFKPMAGRDDAFIEGVVIDANNNEQGYKAFKVKVTVDKFKKYETKVTARNRVEQIAFVPHQTSFMEFDFRVINLSKV